jgi:hypothetical protein
MAFMNSSKYTNFSIVNGIVRWDSNNRVPPSDILDALLASREITLKQHTDSGVASDTETRAFIAEYITANKDREYSDEERFEMRAAFGPGVKVTNIFTGKTVTT